MAADPVEPILTRQTHLDATQAKLLQEVFVSQGYILLKEVVASRCVELQVESINRQLYPSNEASQAISAEKLAHARELNTLLQTLDELEQDKARWYVVTPERRH